MYLVHAEHHAAAVDAARRAGYVPGAWRYVRTDADLHGIDGGELHVTRRATWSDAWPRLIDYALAHGITVVYL